MNPWLLIILSLFLIGCASTSKWSTTEKTKEVTWMVLHTVDYCQTRYAMERPDEFKELNPLLGKHPSEGRLNLFAFVTGIGHVLLTDYLEDYRSLFQNVTIGLKVICVANNYYVGARVEWGGDYGN